MDISDFTKAFPEKLQEIQEYIEGKGLKDSIGREAVLHFKKSFDNEGFTDEVINPWKEVERRKPDSPWYGHSGQTPNFSPERAMSNILTGETGLLRESITFKYLPNGVRVSSEMPYAAVHQYGLPAKIYGKKPFKMPARPFIGKSKALIRKINQKIQRELIKILAR